jgi:phage tail sheath protein FI
VYYQRVDDSAPAISAIRTDIAGFVGISSRGPVDRPIPVQSWRQFQAYFGDFTGAGYLAYSVRAFFENGGRRCWVVRAASPAAEAAGVTLLDSRQPAPREAWRVTASSEGAWGNQLAVRLVETHRAQTRTIPAGSTPDFAVVEATAGFGRGSLVRLAQGSLRAWKVAAGVEPAGQRLLWVHTDPRLRLRYDAPLSGFNLQAPIVIESVEYDLLVWEAGRLLRIYAGLALVPEHARYGPAVLPEEGWHDNPEDFPPAPEPVAILEKRDLDGLPGDGFSPLDVSPQETLYLAGGADGLANLQAYDFTGEPVDPLDDDRAARRKRRGLRALELVGEVAILAVPDILIQPVEIAPRQPQPACIPDPCLPAPPPPPAAPPQVEPPELPPVFPDEAVYQVQAAMVQQCEALRDRIAVLEPPYPTARGDGPGAAMGISRLQAWRSRFDSKYAALYYPWLLVVDPLRENALTRPIPPSGHAAGQYARTDFETGVHKAPANAPLVWVQDASLLVNPEMHGLLNEQGINVVRSFSGRGLRIFGARTVSSDPDWRYVNVRRLLMMIAKAVYLSTQWAVFEPNDAITRAKLHLSLTSFLAALWQKGALMGEAPEQAFFVRCDEDNNPPFERANGRLLAEVGVAPSQPFEFVVLRVGRTGNEFEISETAGGG